MWYVAEDVRTGRLTAFPAWNSAISYDVAGYRDGLRNDIEHARFKCANAVDDAICQIKARILESREDAPADEMADQMRYVEDVERPKIAAVMERQTELVARQMSRVATVEAIILFAGREIPVRSVRLITSANDIESATSRTPRVDITDLPPLDT